MDDYLETLLRERVELADKLASIRGRDELSENDQEAAARIERNLRACDLRVQAKRPAYTVFIGSGEPVEWLAQRQLRGYLSESGRGLEPSGRN